MGSCITVAGQRIATILRGYLGKHYCGSCHLVQEFDLMELKRKIRVCFIPTFTINTKYAVVCKKCKTGLYVDDALRDDIFYGRKEIEK